MNISTRLLERCQSVCELCGTEAAIHAFAVSPRNHDAIENEVALCEICTNFIEKDSGGEHWQCLAGSIWNPEPAVQALSYRLLHANRESGWAEELLQSVEPEEAVVNWAMTAFEKKEVHVDSNGTELLHGDTVILTQGLNVKGANFMAPKGTIVRKIRLVSDNAEQIEGKVNDQTIVILTKYVRKSQG
jgi:protein PhnA